MLTDKDVAKLKEALTTKEDTETLAAMVKRGFDEAQQDRTVLKSTLAEMRADHIQLEDKVDAMSGVLANMPAKHDLEYMLDKTYNLSKIKVEHDRIKRIIHDHLHVEV